MNFIILYSIPFLISLSWLIGGKLIHQISPLSLSTARVALSAVILMLISNFGSQWKSMDSASRKKWILNQLILAITGRVLYYYFSTKSLETISPYEAVLISSLLPLLSFGIESFHSYLRNSIQPSFRVAILAFISCGAVLSALILKDGSLAISFAQGHFFMFVAMLSFAVHLFIYKSYVKESSPVNMLFFQFGFSALVMLTMDRGQFFLEMYSFGTADWVRFLVYTIICGLVPFVFVHYALRVFSSFTIASVSILSPVFSIFMKNVYSSEPLPIMFVVMSMISCAMTYITLRVRAGSFKPSEEVK